MGEFLAEFRNFRCDHNLTVSLVWVAGEVILVVVLGGEEFLERFDLCDDLGIPNAQGLEIRNDLKCGLALRFRMVKDDAAVRFANIIALPVQRGWIVNREEHLENFLERGHARVEIDLDHFGVTGGFATHLTVGRVGLVTAGIARNDVGHANKIIKHGL